MTVSVAMASYNGIVYIERQTASILSQLEDTDELVISDDGSTDGTREFLNGLARRDARVRVLDGPKKGVTANFEHAIRACKGDWIFLSDQDDEWMPDKREAILSLASADTLLVMHDARVVDANGKTLHESFFRLRGSRTGLVKNLLKNSYIGCCIAFSRQLLPYILPFPAGIPMHDQWIGLQAERHGGVKLLNNALVAYRRHGDNASAMTHSAPLTMLRYRAGMLLALLKRR